MDYTNVKIENTKDQVIGRAKEGFGDASNNEELELKGKIQSSTADAKKKAADIKEDTGEMITGMQEKAGEMLTGMKEKAGEKLTDIKEKSSATLNDIIENNEVDIHVAFKPRTLIAGVIITLFGLGSFKKMSKNRSKHRKSRAA